MGHTFINQQEDSIHTLILQDANSNDLELHGLRSMSIKWNKLATFLTETRKKEPDFYISYKQGNKDPIYIYESDAWRKTAEYAKRSGWTVKLAYASRHLYDLTKETPYLVEYTEARINILEHSNDLERDISELEYPLDFWEKLFGSAENNKDLRGLKKSLSHIENICTILYAQTNNEEYNTIILNYQKRLEIFEENHWYFNNPYNTETAQVTFFKPTKSDTPTENNTPKESVDLSTGVSPVL